MDKKQLQELAGDFLQPLISGARLESGSVESTKNHNLVALSAPGKIGFKAEKSDTYRLVLSRSQPFMKVGSETVTESSVVEAFVQVVKGMKTGLKTWYKADLRATFPRRVVVKALCSSREQEESVLGGLDQLASWSGQQYEGKPITAAIGFVPGKATGIVSFNDMCRENFSAVVLNGFDTLLTCNFKGRVLGLETLNPPQKVPEFAPYRLGAVAHWATDGRIAMALNRAGEILVFCDRQLRFTRRGGQWHFLTHTLVITQMGRPDDKDVRRAVYATCIDASFSRTGAAIGIVTSSHSNGWQRRISSADWLRPARSVKAVVLASVVGNKKFQELDRRLRQELVAIDGATLIDHKGTILAVGSILKIDGGSTEGGRLAAAKALGKLGLGIKVSQDGDIKGFQGGSRSEKFVVMSTTR